MLILDFSIKSSEDRVKAVQEILATTPEKSLNLESLANYLIMGKTPTKEILTENRLQTIKKREMYMEDLAAISPDTEEPISIEEALYTVQHEDKQQLLSPKISITQKDLDEIPPLAQLREAISAWEKMQKRASGREAYIIKKALIEMRKDQYLIKDAYRKPVSSKKFNFDKWPISLDQISLTDPKVCGAILVNYSNLKEQSWAFPGEDLWCLMLDFDRLADALPPILLTLLELKVDGLTNQEIHDELESQYNGRTYSPEYISCLWRHKIPKLLAEEAQRQELSWYYLNKEKGHYKVCGSCHEILLANPMFFSRNAGTPDGYYSICKKCRRERRANNGRG